MKNPVPVKEQLKELIALNQLCDWIRSDRKDSVTNAVGNRNVASSFFRKVLLRSVHKTKGKQEV